ncbi:hypothetical protein KKF55_04250 [Patescibacteria group bacterium]|nr:hypothetical protein [Patescibacteria group bacterium]
MKKHQSLLEKCHKAYGLTVENSHPVFHSILIGTAVVLFWRGMWGVLDLYLFPENEALSFVTSILLGILILLIHDGFRKLDELS